MLDIDILENKHATLVAEFDRYWRHEVALVIVWQRLQPLTKPGVSPPVS